MTDQNFHSRCRHTFERRRRAGRICCQALLAGLFLIRTASVFAQAPPPQPAVTVSRSWYLEAAIVAAMFGLALFVVCRSSRRN
jgi:hypothetical protein